MIDLKGKTYKVLDKGYVTVVDYMGQQSRSAQMARQSFGKAGEEDRGQKDIYLNRHLIGSDPAHAEPFGHMILTLHVKLPIQVWRQWLKHRIQHIEDSFDIFEMRQVSTISEASGRYIELGDFYAPDENRMNKQSDDNKQGSSQVLVHKAGTVAEDFGTDLSNTRNVYDYYIECGLAKEVARGQLSLNTYTTMSITANLRNWLDFLRQRVDSHAQWEIRQYAEVIETIIEQLWPDTHAAWKHFVRDSFRLSAGHKQGLAALFGMTEVERVQLVDAWLQGQNWRPYSMGRREARNLALMLRDLGVA